MEDEGIFLFKNSKAKVTDLTAEVTEPALVSSGSRRWIDQLRFPFLGQEIAVVSPEQLAQESKATFPSPADMTALTKEQLRQRQRRTASNRRHKKRTRRQRLIKQRSKNKL